MNNSIVRAAKRDSAAACVCLEPLEQRTLFTAGLLDVTFGQNGVVPIDDLRHVPIVTSASAVQADGKPLLAGTASTETGTQGAIARLDADGSIDATFGDGGVTLLNDPGYTSFTATALALDARGGAIVVGHVVGRRGRALAAVTRLTPDGTVDATFGAAGWATLPFGDSAQVNAVAVSPDGAILLGGSDYARGGGGTFAHRYNDFAFARLTEAGGLDATFGRRGYAVVSFPVKGGRARYFPSTVYALSYAGDGRIVAAGGGAHEEVARLNADGTRDPSFGVDGRVVLPSYAGRFSSVALAADGDIYAAGGTPLGEEVDVTRHGFVVAAFTPDGRPDVWFGQGGALTETTAPGRTRVIFADAGGIAVGADGQIVVSGDVSRGGKLGVFLARLDAHGALDAGFGSGGRSVLPIVSDLGGRAAYGALPVGGGDFLVPFASGVPIGTASAAIPLDIEQLRAAQFSADGSLDTSYGVAGIAAVASPLGAGQNSVGEVVPDAAGNFYVTGRVHDVGDVVARYTADGVLDAAFGDAGRITTRNGISGIATTGDGGVLLASAVDYFSTRLEKHLADGSLDAGFDRTKRFGDGPPGSCRRQTARSPWNSTTSSTWAGPSTSA